MKIYLSPQRRDDVLEVVKTGDILTVNGEDFDLSPIGEGDLLPQDAVSSPWFAGDITRTNGELEVTLLLPNPWNYSPEQAFPVPLIDVPDGPVEFPLPLNEEETMTKLYNEQISFEASHDMEIKQ